MFAVYILKSLKNDNWHYLGCTNNLERRLKQHQAGHTPSTKKWRPLELIYKEHYSTKSEAYKREWYLKHPKGYKEKLLILNKCARSSAG